MEFNTVQTPDFHIERRKQMMKKYPKELRALMGNHPMSAFWILLCVGVQFATAYFLKDSSIWLILATAWIFGAWFNHALYVFVHDATHNLVFKSGTANRFMGMICDFALFTPSAMAFRKYHLMHHARMGQFEFDADLVTPREAKIVGNNPLMKTLWVLFLGLSQGMRPMRMSAQGFWDKWIITNTLLQVGVIVATFYFLGVTGAVYLFASSFFGLGLHPLGARWIAEHFLTDPNQETYSYYGPMNRFMFNVGFHTEHHDLMTIPWVNLPRVREVAPEFYHDLKSYSSYPKLLIQFIVDPKLSLYSRTLRKNAKVDASDDAPLHTDVSASPATMST